MTADIGFIKKRRYSFLKRTASVVTIAAALITIGYFLNDVGMAQAVATRLGIFDTHFTNPQELMDAVEGCGLDSISGKSGNEITFVDAKNRYSKVVTSVRPSNPTSADYLTIEAATGRYFSADKIGFYSAYYQNPATWYPIVANGDTTWYRPFVAVTGELRVTHALSVTKKGFCRVLHEHFNTTRRVAAAEVGNMRSMQIFKD